MSFCPNCGFNTGEAAKFCSRCGINMLQVNQLLNEQSFPEGNSNQINGNKTTNGINSNILNDPGSINDPSFQSQAAGAINTGISGQVVSALNSGISQPMTSISSQLTGTVISETVGIAKSTIKAKIFAVTLIAAIVTAGTILYNMYFVTKPIDVVNKLFNALNEKDFNTVMQCIDPAQEKLYNATSAIVNKFVGVSLKDMVDLIPALFPMMAQNPSVDKSQIIDWKFNIEKVISEQQSGDEDTLTLMVREEMTEKSGKKTIKEEEGIIRLRKFNEGWRVVE